jgi:uncharacterized DUF497 family protein
MRFFEFDEAKSRADLRKHGIDLWMVESLDREASKLGVTRQSIIKYGLPSALKNQE